MNSDQLPKCRNSDEVLADETRHDGAKLITMSEVAGHVTCDDFWTVIEGSVYDMSGFAKVHPGGSLIMVAAGTDSTVMYNQYHDIDGKRLQSLLESRLIGVVSGHVSPVMGEMWKEMKKRVTEKLRGVAKRPNRAKAMFVLDCLASLILVIWSLGVTGSTPWWQLFLASIFTPSVHMRLFGQSHALGHMHLFPAYSVRLCSRVLMLLGAPGTAMFVLPDFVENPRKKLNDVRAIAQAEFLQRRGPCEHQSIHHVRGAELEEDECLQVASMFTLTRLAGHQTHFPHHYFQNNRVYLFACSAFANLSLVTAVSMVEHIVFLPYFFKKSIVDLVISLVGCLTCLSIARAYLFLPASSWSGFLCFLLACLVNQLVFGSVTQMFYAQHQWDVEVDESIADTDWGKHNAETCTSLRGVEAHPICWGMMGATTSTITYHLEHTLFPGVSYINLPIIAPIVEATCREFGVTPDVVYGPHALREKYMAEMTRLAQPGGDAIGASYRDQAVPFFVDTFVSVGQACANTARGLKLCLSQAL